MPEGPLDRARSLHWSNLGSVKIAVRVPRGLGQSRRFVTFLMRSLAHDSVLDMTKPAAHSDVIQS